MHYTRPRSGEWVPVKQDGYLFECCDCGLVHRMDFITVDNLVGWPVRIRASLAYLINLLGARTRIRVFRDQKETRIRRARRNASCDMAEF